jgi:hypothetical protein
MPSVSLSASEHEEGAHIALVPQVVSWMLLQVSEAPHTSAVQLLASTHEMPQPPQLLVVVVATLQPFACSVLSQLVNPGRQVEVHTPPVQLSVCTLVALQVVPQEPQLATLVCVFTQPMVGSPLQF